MDETMETKTEAPREAAPEAPQTPHWEVRPQRIFPVGGKEMILALVTLACALGAVNSLFYGGLNLMLALFLGAYMAATTAFLFVSGKAAPDGYALPSVIFTCLIALSMLRNDDAFLKFLLLCICMVAYPMTLLILTGQNRRDPGKFSTILDGFHAIFVRTLGDAPAAVRGLFKVNKSSRSRAVAWSVIKGLLLAAPVLLVLLFLLISADAAFERIMELLPDIELGEAMVTIIFGCLLFMPFFGLGMSLVHGQREPLPVRVQKTYSVITANTILISVCLVYAVYLVSQLAYFVDGFSGLLPKGFTAASYARRGFFEMVFITIINLIVLGVTASRMRTDGKLPGFTAGLCTFIGIMTLFFVGSAMSKMLLYIRYYGLTYSRVLTSLFMVWAALAAVLLTVNLYRDVPYMKALVLVGLLGAALVSWAGLDTYVARYNVHAYQSGKLETVDVNYLQGLGNAAVPYLAELLDDPDPEVAGDAGMSLRWIASWDGLLFHDYDWVTSSDHWERLYPEGDLRQWNITASRAEEILNDLLDTDRLPTYWTEDDLRYQD